MSIAAYTTLTPADIHADIDVHIRKADGTIRGTIAENVADTRNIPETTWQTVTAVYYFQGYTVVDDTDYLEIDLFAHATSNVTSTTMALSFSLDDSSLAVADQSRIREDVPTVMPPPPTYASGKYTGNGIDGKLVTGVGFQPDVVIIKADAAQVPVIRTSSMAGDSAKPVLKVALASNLIQSLETDGFTLGTDAKVNADGVTYYWSAFMANPGEIKVGSYVGIGNSQVISGVGFAPEAVLVMAATDDEMNITTSAMPTAHAMQLDDEDGKTNRITSLDGDGFTVGASGQANGTGKTYHYVAWNAVAGKMSVGSYEGNGSDDRSIIGIGFEPKYIIVKAFGDISAVHHPDAIGTGSDETLGFMAQAAFANGIQSLGPDGFEVGSDTTVNAASTSYYWLAFRPRP